jgi:hypothetical protein
VRAYREHASEYLVALLRPVSVRGSWSGQALAATGSVREGEPVASLTRAAIRPLKAARFWRHSPPAESDLARAPGCGLAVGLGEAPLLRQATFSVWDNQAAMDAYARGSGHARASAGAWREDWFSEWMFVRFAPLEIAGRWQGRVYE